MDAANARRHVRETRRRVYERALADAKTVEDVTAAWLVKSDIVAGCLMSAERGGWDAVFLTCDCRTTVTCPLCRATQRGDLLVPAVRALVRQRFGACDIRAVTDAGHMANWSDFERDRSGELVTHASWILVSWPAQTD
jgi:hypothetical protein